MCISIYVHIHTHTVAHTHKHTHTHTHTHTHNTHTQTHTHMYIYIYIHTCIYIHTYKDRRSNSDPDIRGYDKTQTMTSSTGSSFKCRVIRDDHRNEESVRDCPHDESRVRGSNGDRAMHITREERQTVEYLSFSSNANQGL
jgi:hypothetical protein